MLIKTQKISLKGKTNKDSIQTKKTKTKQKSIFSNNFSPVVSNQKSI